MGERETFGDAVATCADEGGRLVEPRFEFEMEAVNSQIEEGNKPIWIGAVDEGDNEYAV